MVALANKTWLQFSLDWMMWEIVGFYFREKCQFVWIKKPGIPQIIPHPINHPKSLNKSFPKKSLPNKLKQQKVNKLKSENLITQVSHLTKFMALIKKQLNYEEISF
jgi:hypothetical protein